MTTDNNERDLKLLFGELKAADERHTPPFGGVGSSHAARQQAHGSSGRFNHLLAAGAVALLMLMGTILAFGIFRSRPDTATKEEEQWAAFSNWEAATDSLLAVSSDAGAKNL
jgi:hypothetical protein